MRILHKGILFVLCFIIILAMFGCELKGRKTTPDIGNNNTNTNSNEISSTTYKENIITIEEAIKEVEDFCRRPNIGVQVVHEPKFDFDFSGVKYYYFDVIYGLLMGDKPKDDTIKNIFVNSKDKSLYMAVKSSGDSYKIGEKLK